MTFSQIVHEYREGRRTPVDIVDDCLQRIDRWDDQICAWVHLDRNGAREAAAQLAEELAHGDCRGPLHGIPIGVKDIIDVKGMPTRAASPLTRAAPAVRDASAVGRLRNAGAIILGKTVTTEFACYDPPPTRNPWNLRHTPGGSSSGSAAAVAMRMCLGAIGTQTGGSIIRPASYCGVCGCKPTFGAVAMDGVYPVSAALDHLGPIARSVADLKTMLGLLLAPCANEEDYDTQPTSPPRLGVIEQYFSVEVDDTVAGSMRKIVDRLRAAGATLLTLSPPGSFKQVHEMHRTIMLFEAARLHHVQFAAYRDQYGPKMAELLTDGSTIVPARYQAALDHQQRFRDEMANGFGDADVLITPATATTAPPSLETTGDPKFNSPWTYAGLPVVSLPAALADDGLPVALQLIGRPASEERLLAAAAWCEEQLAFDKSPPAAE